MSVAAVPDAEAARRLGGGQSLGRQSSNVTKREQAAPAPGTPAATPQQTAPQTPPPAPSRPWGGILGGLAAGLGLAWLAHTLGFGAGFANFVMIALVAV